MLYNVLNNQINGLFGINIRRLLTTREKYRLPGEHLS